MNPLDQLAKIHQSGYKAILAITGGGTGAINGLLEHGGGSAFLLEAIVPYGEESLTNFLGHKPEKFVSDLTARQLAMAAYIKAGKLTKEKVVGLGATCSLAKTDEREGRKHVVHLAYQTRDTTCTFRTELHSTRELEEAEVSQLIVDFLSDAVAGTNSIEPTDKIIVNADLAQLLHGERSYYWAKDSGATYPKYVFPGSFNPLHDGHKEMAEIAKNTDGPVLFEMSVTNPDKLPLDYIEINRRVAQFNDCLVLTNAPLFVDKAKLFRHRTFIVGIDTWERIIDPKYCGDILDQLRTNCVKFMVFPRAINGVTKKLEAVVDNHMYSADGILAYPAPGPRNYAHVSSTEIRKIS
jgi:hypothetical protein